MAEKPRQAYHQDYIARIRYSNALPPPPCPPKLLDIPNTGLSSGQYTSAGFASRLAREQPMVIEADAELGMTIDMVGIPGVFDGDDSAINALDRPPVLHPADKALCRPPTQLGKPASGASGISFLRRTEYTTSFTVGGFSKLESSNSTNTIRKSKRRRANLAQEDPVNIARHIQKGFDLAYPADAYTGPDTADRLRGAEPSYEEKQAWRAPKHPTKPQVHLLDSYPLLPDWDALPDTGAYMVYRFAAPPVQDDDGSYDERLDVSMLRPAGTTVEDQERYMADLAASKVDPTLNAPFPKYHFEFFLPASADAAKIRGIKRNFTTNDPDNTDVVPFETGTDEDGRTRKYFKYENLRTYETINITGTPEDSWGDSLAMALHDPETHDEEPLRTTKLQKAAYFYPISQKTNIRPVRPHKAEMVGGEQQKVDIIETAARDPVNEADRRAAFRKRYDNIET